MSCRYEIGNESIPGKPHIRFAVNRLTMQPVVLNFCLSRESLERAMQFNGLLSSRYVCKSVSFNSRCFLLDFFCDRVVEYVDDDRLGYPPCLVYERGDQTLEQFMCNPLLDPFTKKSILFQVTCFVCLEKATLFVF